MYQRILFPTDGSDISIKALHHAVSLARLCGASLHVLSVKEPFPFSAISEMNPTLPQDFFDQQERVAMARVKAAIDTASAAGVPCSGHTLEASHAWQGILEQAKAQDCELIVMASHGRRGIGALLLGSETQKVLTHGNVPVLVVR